MKTPWHWIALAIAVLAGSVVIAPSNADAQTIRLVPVVTTGLTTPVFVTHAGDGSGRLFILEQPGRIRILAKGALVQRPFLDLSPTGADRVLAGGERGLLGLA